ncbi:methylated-DNA--[protein]-cysteine S-methyltransferase [Streptococcus sp. DD13]|uniref:methylated-DNA--[protein]-cysteine S-methyltransferase n=1 Tax=Streptococcus sp. DD13 TaxID=1777881 RepID=UPI000791ED5C|nr:methylated-DNA--[protein]-cysteine S-methyltransferase [Streptococcus sp. DD13]KXT78469.1 Methylated-DNA--protein-cysteine methyltransferase [Streptococcus sp. DD13]
METIRYCKQIYPSPLGDISIVTSQKTLHGLWFWDQRHKEAKVDELQMVRTPLHEQVFHWLDAYFSGNFLTLDIELAHSGTPFQEAVWAQLREIPLGKTKTYKEIGNQLGCSSSQAIGNAVSRNPFSILVPCHRVIGTNGSLKGYAGGLARKNWLLQHEGYFEKEKICIPSTNIQTVQPVKRP